MLRRTDLEVKTTARLMDRYKLKSVKLITRAFIQEIIGALVEQEELCIEGLGTFKVHVIRMKKVPRVLKQGPKGGKRTLVIDHNVRVSFSKSVNLRERLKEKKHGQVRSR